MSHSESWTVLNKCLSLLCATAIIRRIVIKQVRLIFEYVFRKRKYVRKKVYNQIYFSLTIDLSFGCHGKRVNDN